MLVAAMVGWSGNAIVLERSDFVYDFVNCTSCDAQPSSTYGACFGLMDSLRQDLTRRKRHLHTDMSYSETCKLVPAKLAWDIGDPGVIVIRKLATARWCPSAIVRVAVPVGSLRPSHYCVTISLLLGYRLV